MSAEKWAVRKVRGYWAVIPPDGERLPGYVRTGECYIFPGNYPGWKSACWVLRDHLDRRRT